MKILVNVFGIKDSGGIRVFDKLLQELCLDSVNDYFIFYNNSENINFVISNYKKNINLKFYKVHSKGFLHRLYYENISFLYFINRNKIDIIYNFSGSFQIFLKKKQLLKVQNLLFYSKKLDSLYIKKLKILSFFKDIYLKRLVFRYMLSKSTHIEIQSAHVKNNIGDFIDIKDKIFYIKSDINIKYRFLEPKKYDFTKKIKILYIVGPHFNYLHKNFTDFVEAMLMLKDKKIDFEINITLLESELHSSILWNTSLDENTNFLGYIKEKKNLEKLFCDNTILISTSVIETIGLHVVESIKNGIAVIVPNEQYAFSVYGNDILHYKLFSPQSLLNLILSIIESKVDITKKIVSMQKNLKLSEDKKYESIVDILEKVNDV